MYGRKKNQGSRKGGVDVRDSSDTGATTAWHGSGEAGHQLFDGNALHAMQAMNYAQALRERSNSSSLFPTSNTQFGVFPSSSPSVNFIMGVDKMSALQMAEHILKEYRTLDCSCCNKFFGYMHRQTGAIFCSSNCLSSGSNAPGHTFGHAILPAPTPLTPQQILAVTNHVGHPEVNGIINSPQPQVPTKEITKPSRDSISMTQKIAPFSKKNEDVEVTRKSVPEVSSSRESGSELRSRTKKAEDVDAVDNRPNFKEIRKVNRLYGDDKTVPFARPKDEPQRANKEVDVSSGTNPPTPILVEKNPLGKESPVVKEQNPFSKAKAETPAPSPAPETSKEVTTKKPPGKQETSEAKEEEVWNPFLKKPVKETSPPTAKDIIVIPNPMVLKLRSALPFSTDPDEFIGRPLLGGKCNDNGPVDFYFQSVTMAKKLSTLQGDINNFSATATALPIQNLEIGQLVFAPYGEELFRGEIIGIPKPDHADVFYVDYGNTMTLQKKQLSALPKEFFDVPRLCFHCQWDFWLAKDPGEELSENDANRYHSTESKGITPIMKIGEGQYLVAIGPKAENVNFSVQPFKKLEKISMKVERPLPPFKSAPVAQRKKFMFKNCEYSPLLQEGSVVKISYAWDTSKYMIISPDDEEAILNLQIIVNESIGSAKAFKSIPDVGEVVLAPYQQEYYRAKVVSQQDDGNVKVMFFDFGDAMSVNFSELYEPSDKIMQHPIYAMDIQLEGVPEIKESITLDQDTDGVLASNMQLQIKKRPEGDSDVFSVTLWKGDETLNRIIKRVVQKALELERLEAELHAYGCDETYLGRLCSRNEFTRTLLENYKREQTAIMHQYSFPANLPCTYKWSAYDTQFCYLKDSVSLVPLKGVVDFTVVKYRRIDKIFACLQSKQCEIIRESLSSEIGKYVTKAQWDASFEPQKSQVCLVKYPMWWERSAIFIKIHGNTWFTKNNHLLDKVDTNHSGKWHRAFFKIVQLTDSTTYYGFEFSDLGKFCWVPKTYVYKSPLRFVVAPLLRTTLVILWNEPIQMTKRLELALEYVMKPGFKLKVLVVAEHDDVTLVRLLEPDEKKIIEQGFGLLQRAEMSYKRQAFPKHTKLAKTKISPPKSLRILMDQPGLVPDSLVVNTNTETTDGELDKSMEDFNNFVKSHYGYRVVNMGMSVEDLRMLYDL